MEVRRTALGVAGVADEADDVARLDTAPLDRKRRVRRKVRVVELVALGVAQPEPVAADLGEPDRVERAVGDREQRRALGGEDVLPVVPAAGDVRPRAPEAVAERGRAVDGEDVAARGELAPRPPARPSRGRRRPHRRRRLAQVRGEADPGVRWASWTGRRGSSTEAGVAARRDQRRQRPARFRSRSRFRPEARRGRCSG